MAERPRVERILLVDDDEHSRNVAEGHLAAAGYAITTAKDGFQALELFEKRRPDLVILDVLMPGMDGLQTCQRLRRLEGGQDVPILIATALGDLAPHLETGADDYLAKPLQRTELLSRVSALLSVRRLREELREGRERIHAQEEELVAVRKKKEELVVLAVHDIKRPVARILAVSEGLLAGAVADGATRAGLAEIHAAASRVRRMVLNLLEVARGETIALVPRMEPLELGVLVRDVARTTMSEVAGGRVDCDVPAITLPGDRYLLARVFENLLENCLEHAPAGTNVTVRAEVRDGHVEVRVSDQGPGIPPAVRERVFTRSVELERSDLVPQRVGHGLGLVFCRYALTLHGGTITIADNVPRGTSFVVRLPLAVAPSPAAPAPA